MASVKGEIMTPMKKGLANLVSRLNALVDWFIPAHLKESRDLLQAVRMFMFSHLLGPFLGHTISLFMLYVGGRADLSWWILFLSISAFWLYPIVLRLTGSYIPLALLSIQNLMFCIFWGCYQYGGISSPIMPWLVTVPLLAFFYLPERSTRITVGALIVTNLSLYFVVYSTMGFRETVAIHSLVVLGLVSTLCASTYVSMMALYFASIVFSQGELEEEIQRHQATEVQLRDATDQAQRALLAKSGFLAKMSHELRNPLNAIIGYSEILIDEASGEDIQKSKDLNSIRSAGYRLLGLINDLLELSRLEAGKVEVRLEEFELADLLEALASRLRPTVIASGNELVVKPFPAGRIACDSQKFLRVVEGVLSNASKFTSNGRITLSAEVRDDSWVVAIEDTGVGIAQSRMAGLFETFGRSEDETASKYADEVRLGLPLAYRYCKLLGGKLSVQSELGLGTSVTVTLPRQSRDVETQTNTDRATDLVPA
jgi:signal transduction histidine kinase